MPVAFTRFLLLALIAVTAMQEPAFALSQTAVEYYNKARNELYNNRYDAAEQAIHQAITFDDYDPLLFITLGQIHQKQGYVEKAIDAYERAAQLDSKDPSIYFTLATLYEQTSNQQKAADYYKISLTKNPSFRYAKARLARIQGFSGDYVNAIKGYEEYLQQTPQDLEAHRQVAQFAVSAKQPEKAASHLLYVKQVQQENFKDEALLARAFLMANLPTRAVAELESAQAKGRSSGEVADLKAQAEEDLGQIDEAIADLKIAAQSNTDNASYNFRLARLFYQKNNVDEALKNLNIYLAKNPDDLEAQVAKSIWLNKHNSFALANAHATQLLETKGAALSAEQALELKTQLAYAALKTDQSKRAADLYEGILRDIPANANNVTALRQNLAVAYYDSKNYDQALTTFEALINSGALTPDETANIKKDVYLIYLKKGKDAVASKSMKDAQRFFGNAKTYAANAQELQAIQLEMGALSFASNDTTAAKESYEAILKTDPTNVEARLNLANLISGEDAPRALLLIQGLDSSPSLAEDSQYLAKRIKADALINDGKSDEAFTLLKDLQSDMWAGKNSAMTAESAMQLGALYHGKQNYPEAEGAYKKALQLKPDYSLAAYNLGSLYLNKKEYANAKTAMEQAIKGDAPVTQAYYALGLLEENAKNYNAAYTYISKYLAKGDAISSENKKRANEKLVAIKPKVTVFEAVKPANPAKATDRIDVTTGKAASPSTSKPTGRIAL